ncbi:MAG: hypothetical protein WCT12_22555 [Verrucomicrobiota bacterium]
MNYTTSLKSSGMRKVIPKIGDYIQPVLFAFNNYSLSRYWYSSLNQVASFPARAERAARTSFADRLTGGATLKTHTRHADRTSGSRFWHFTK